MQRRCLSRGCSGNARQRQCLSREGNGNTQGKGAVSAANVVRTHKVKALSEPPMQWKQHGEGADWATNAVGARKVKALSYVGTMTAPPHRLATLSATACSTW